MNPAMRHAIDQAGAFIRDEAEARGQGVNLRDNPAFQAGVSFGIALVLKYMREQMPASAFEVGEAWSEHVRGTWGL